MAADVACGSCGTGLRESAKFCDECGARTDICVDTAEYKQVTVLFADVVHSMYIASVVGAERLREIMAELVNITTAVVKRYGGTVDKFTGDGIMAVFGAPLALEDHAVRACLAALEIQDELARLAAQVRDHDGVELALRIGLNSGQVIAGEVSRPSDFPDRGVSEVRLGIMLDLHGGGKHVGVWGDRHLLRGGEIGERLARPMPYICTWDRVA